MYFAILKFALFSFNIGICLSCDINLFLRHVIYQGAPHGILPRVYSPKQRLMADNIA